MKICLLTNRYPAHPDDTASPFVYDFYSALKQRGIEVKILTPGYAVDKVEKNPDLIRFPVRSREKTVGGTNLFSLADIGSLISFVKTGEKTLSRLIETEKIDFCLALWALPSGYFAYQAFKKFNIPYAVWCLGSDIYVWAKKPFFKQLIRKILKNASFLFADGFDLKEKVKSLTGKDCRFLPSFRKLDTSGTEEVDLEKDKKNFLYVGRWDRSKGVLELIRAFQKVIQEAPDVRLYLIGWGPAKEEINNLVHQLKLDNYVHLAGQVSKKRLCGYYQNCSCVVIPSYKDSIPLVFSEALQFKKPVLVSNVGDMGYLTNKYKVGKVVQAGEIQGLARAMLEMIKEERDYSRNISELLNLLDIQKAADIFLDIINSTRELNRNLVASESKVFASGGKELFRHKTGGFDNQ